MDTRSGEVSLLEDMKKDRSGKDLKYLKEVHFNALNETQKSLLRQGKRFKIGRNDPCLCGSGKKFKKCCYMKEA